MKMLTPDTRFNFGICDVEENYQFYFKWLLSKVCDAIVIKDAPDSIDIDYLKQNLILNGEICITDFNDKLYACIGSRGGEPNEYYRPTQFIIANPILGSKTVDIDKTGVVIYNTGADKNPYWFGGLWQLIKQTATLLADNIVSINCAQINSRVEAVFTADSEGQAAAGEVTLKKLYQGHPYQIVRQNILEKINVNPMSTGSTSVKIAQLIELHQYIIAQFYQAIGIKANAINKKERLITDEINSQDDYLAISLLDLITSWREGFEKVNEMYGTDIKVELNPVLEHVIEQPSNETESETEPEVESETDSAAVEEENGTEVEAEVETKPETEPEAESTATEIIDQAMDENVEVKDNDQEPENN